MLETDWSSREWPVGVVDARQLLLAVAHETGGASAAVLRRIEQVERDARDALERLRVAEVAPRATARLMLWLPFGAILAGQAIGIDIIAGLAQPLGAMCFGLGLSLLWFASGWMKRIVSGAAREPSDRGLALELLSVALGSGESLTRAEVVARAEMQRAGFSIEEPVAEKLREIVEQGRESGESVVGLLRETADEFRAEALRERLASIERASVKLTLPLGLVALPAFALMTVVPSAIASFRSVG